MTTVVPIVLSQLRPDEVHPTRGRVLLEAIPEMDSEHIILPSFDRYSSIGWVVEAGPGVDLIPNDLVIIRDEGHNTDQHTYYDAFTITLTDHKETVKLVVESDRELVFKEKMDRYTASPSMDFMISVMDVEDQGWTFNASDVREWGFEEFAHPTWKMEYLPTYMIELNMGEGNPYRLHYIIDESNILGVVHANTD
jgi:hypothetical protein